LLAGARGGGGWRLHGGDVAVAAGGGGGRALERQTAEAEKQRDPRREEFRAGVQIADESSTG